MKRKIATDIIHAVLESCQLDEYITEIQANFLKRLLADCFYDKKFLNRTIEHYKETFPEMFGE